MEKDIEERLRSKFALIDRTDPSAIQAAQQVRVIAVQPHYNTRLRSEFAKKFCCCFFPGKWKKT